MGLLYFAPLMFAFHISSPARLPPIPDLSVYPWIYLRHEKPLGVDERLVSVIVAGDILCGRGGNSFKLDLRDVASWLRPADLVMGNLECVISTKEAETEEILEAITTQPYRLYGAPQQAVRLREAGFDVLGVANNHAFDLGNIGLAETVHYLRQNGMEAVGQCENADCEVQVIFQHVGNLRIAIIAFNAVPLLADTKTLPAQGELSIVNWRDSHSLISAVKSVRQQSNAVIVSVHWGYEYETRIDPAQREIAGQLMAAGADLVVGHHPHVPQRVEIYSHQEGQPDGVVAYSLGNFLADQQFGETVNGLALRAFFDGQGLRAVQALPLLAGPHPRLLEIDQAGPLLEHIMPEPNLVTFTCVADTCFEEKRPTIEKETLPISGLFWSGEIDLTGDGLPEQIQRQAGQVYVYQDGKEAWQTPQDWEVVDLALGDPDSDGRQEMMMAFWRPDHSGMLRSHPFIVGYRGGTYHETWGGSGVSDPILEVELGDVDGDGAQELMVLEKRQSGKQAVTVWDWHGWGFSLKWRSPEGKYEDMRVMPGASAGNDLIRVYHSVPSFEASN
jgi:poly-gamma-glutamate synthesis protein (capsule biosynthesis protein)